jgi:hypothetical protein
MVKRRLDVNIYKKNFKHGICENIKRNILIVMMIVFSCEMTFAAESITVETRDANFFRNFVTDTVLLLDNDLKTLLADDIENIVRQAKFGIQPNSWKPKPSPKNKLSSVYSRINKNNLKEAFADLVQPVVEIACTSQKYDPLREASTKCIKDMLVYPIIEQIQIDYTYNSKKTFDQFVSDLTELNSNTIYPQMIRTAADIMNSAFEKIQHKSVVKTVSVIKYPLALQTEGIAFRSGVSYGGNKTVFSSNCKKPSFESGSGLAVSSRNQILRDEYRHCLEMELVKAGGTVNRTVSKSSDNSNISKDIGQCFGYCGSEQGICIGRCSGNGSCTANCASAHGRCVAQCSR